MEQPAPIVGNIAPIPAVEQPAPIVANIEPIPFVEEPVDNLHAREPVLHEVPAAATGNTQSS